MTVQPSAGIAPAPPEPLSDRFSGVPLPAGLREAADAMPWSLFTATYAPTAGPLRLGHWECADADRPATRPGLHGRTFRATIGLGDRIETATATATGPVAALTAMLYDLGIALETLRFHQLRAGPDGQDTATFIRGSDGRHDAWAMGWSQDPTQSALRAVIACANRLLSAA